MNKNLILTIAVVTLIGGLLGGYVSGLVGGNQSGTLGGSTADDWNVGGNLTVTGTSAHGEIETIVSSGSLTTATATIVYVLNPFSASSTIDLAEINVTTAPPASVAAITYICGTTTVPGAEPSATLITSGATPTSTTVYLVNGVNGMPGVSNGAGNARIFVGPSEYVACYISTASSTAALAEIAGTYRFRWLR